MRQAQYQSDVHTKRKPIISANTIHRLMAGRRVSLEDLIHIMCCCLRRSCSLSRLMSNFISSASDRNRKKITIQYNTTKREASTDFRTYSLNPLCQIMPISWYVCFYGWFFFHFVYQRRYSPTPVPSFQFLPAINFQTSCLIVHPTNILL